MDCACRLSCGHIELLNIVKNQKWDVLFYRESVQCTDRLLRSTALPTNKVVYSFDKTCCLPTSCMSSLSCDWANWFIICSWLKLNIQNETCAISPIVSSTCNGGKAEPPIKSQLASVQNKIQSVCLLIWKLQVSQTKFIHPRKNHVGNVYGNGM